MVAIVLGALKAVAKSMLMALLTEAFIKEVIIFGLEKLAESTDNKVDDKLVEKVKKALNAESK